MKMPVLTLCRGLLATAFSLIALNAVSAPETFEGRVSMDVTSGRKSDKMAIQYAIKNGKMRMDMPRENSRRGGDGSGGVIMDFQNKEMIILMEHDGQKNYMRRSIADRGREGRQSSPPVATGRTEVIAGYPSAEYKTTTEKGEIVEMWLAKGIGPYMSMSGGSPMGGRKAPSPEWESFARDGNLFPMRVITRSAKGVEESRMEVTKIDKTPLPDSLFSTEGYTEFKMPDFGALNPFKH